MIKLGKLFILLVLFLVSACAVTEGTDQAEFEVDRFHKLYNAGDYKQIYQRSHDEFKGFVSTDQLTQILQKLSHSLGQHRSSHLINWSINSSFLGNGTKITVVFSAEYEFSNEVRETFTFYKNDNVMKLYNFNVSAAELATKPKKVTEI